MVIRKNLLLFLFLRLILVVVVAEVEEEATTCGWDDRETCEGTYRDPNLKPMKVQFEDGTTDEDFYAYVLPDITKLYDPPKPDGSMKITETKFRGQMGKFINMSKKPIQILYRDRHKQTSYIADVEPFGAAGTATYPGHNFVFVEASDPSNILHEVVVTKGNAVYAYDPYGSLEEAKKTLVSGQIELYTLQYRNLEFSRLYREFTGTEWLALYGRKYAPRYPIWPANHFGQVHTIVTEETHLVEFPPDEFAKKRVHAFGARDEDRMELKKYKGPEPTLTLNMTVISVAPRAFEIPNFLSQTEVTHILEIATGLSLHQSTTKAGNIGDERTDDSTRTSTNTWIERSRTPIIESIIRRSADLLQIDEALLRRRELEEDHLCEGSRGSINEKLQLVHYDVGQQYTPHHDFAIPDTDYGQPSRFATILFYLNDVPEGGETSFPRWMNGENKDILKVKPEVGKAVLFYNQLPDGNYDERSQHAALPVKVGEKWLTNLWVWDPHMGGW